MELGNASDHQSNSVLQDSLLEEKALRHADGDSRSQANYHSSGHEDKNNTSSVLSVSRMGGDSVAFQLDKKGKHIQKEYHNYLKNTGIQTAFEIVFNEIVANQLKDDEVFTFAAARLREIGNRLKEVDQL